MGDILHLPPRPEVVERYQAVKTYGTFGRMSVTMARGHHGRPGGLLALCLDGLPEGVGFEVLGRVEGTQRVSPWRISWLAPSPWR